MKKISQIAIVYSSTRKTDEALDKVTKIIESSDCKVVLSSNIKRLNLGSHKKASKADLILVLGGDGTMIGSIRNLYSLNVPFLGINSGTVGFLTDLSLSKIDNLKDISLLIPEIVKNKDKILNEITNITTDKKYL